MNLTSDILVNNKILTYEFDSCSVESRKLFFYELMSLASHDLALAHSMFKTSAVRTVLSTVGEKLPTHCIGSFSVHKTFDTVTLNNNTLHGKKHWVTNASSAGVVIVQVMTDAGIMLCKTAIPDKKEQFLNSPGMMDADTYDLLFEGESAEPLFLKTDSKYVVVSKHNTLAFIANHLGAIRGLLANMSDKQDLFAQYKNMLSLFDQYILDSNNPAIDDYWHKRNALYLQTKHLLVKTLQSIIENHAGAFYGVNSPQGKHFFNCLTYSGHNGPIQRNYQQIFTEPQDY